MDKGISPGFIHMDENRNHERSSGMGEMDRLGRSLEWNKGGA